MKGKYHRKGMPGVNTAWGEIPQNQPCPIPNGREGVSLPQVKLWA